MDYEENEQLKETSRFHLEIPFHALSSFRKDGDYGAKRLWRLEVREVICTLFIPELLRNT